MKRYLIIGALCLVPLFATECSTSDQQVQFEQWTELGILMKENIAETKQKLHLVTDPIARAGIEAKLTKMEEISTAFNDTLAGVSVVDDPASGDTEAAAIEGVLAAAAGLTGGLSLLGIPFIRLFRQRKQIFKAVSAGGGVQDVAAAKKVLKQNAGAWAALQKFQANGG